MDLLLLSHLNITSKYMYYFVVKKNIHMMQTLLEIATWGVQESARSV